MDFNELWNHLEEFQDQTLIIKGFLYETKERTGVISNAPNVKSCCIKVISHLLITGNIPRPLIKEQQIIVARLMKNE